jgi:hypothetical protein
MATEKQKKVQVKRPVNKSAPVQPDKWDGKFKSVEPLKNQKPSRERKNRYKWNHPATINWIMGQADPVVYTQDEQGNVQDIGKVGADPELRIMAAKTLLSKCMPDLKAVEVTAQIEEKKILDISKLTGDDLNAIERVLEHAIIEGDQGGENAEIIEGLYQEQLAGD